MSTLADLIAKAPLLNITDVMGGIYDRLFTLLGDSTEPYSTTLSQAGVTAASPAVGGTLTLNAVSAAWPDEGVVTIGVEKVLYNAKSVAANTITVQQRGYSSTPPTAHASGDTVYAPSSIARTALRKLQYIDGDGLGIVLGVGAAANNVILSLAAVFNNQVTAAKNGMGGLLQSYFSADLNQLNSHVASVAPQVLVGTPTFGALTPSSILDYLRWLNDPTTGTAFSSLVCSEFDYLYWLNSGGVPLDGKTVFPAITSLSTYADGGAGWVTPAGLKRYSATNSVTYTPGYSAQNLRVRCTAVAGAAANLLTLQAATAGQHTDGRYYGRCNQVIVAVGTDNVTANVPHDGDTINVTGVVFTSRTVPATNYEYLIGANNAATATNMAAAINNVVTLGLQTVMASLSATSSSNGVFITTATTDLTLYTVTVPQANLPRLSLTVGTVANQILGIFGWGGVGGATTDSGQPNGVPADDDSQYVGLTPTFQIIGATNATPVSYTTIVPHGLTTGQSVIVTGCTGNTGANTAGAVATVISSTTFTLAGTTGNGAYLNGGVASLILDTTVPSATITGATFANPIVVTTSANHNLTDGQTVNIAGVTGNTNANGLWQVHVLTATTFQLVGIAGNAGYVSGGVVSGTVDLTMVGSFCPLVPGVAGDRVHSLNATTTALTKTGAGVGYSLAVETIPDRIIV